MSLASDLLAEAEALAKVAANRDKHTESLGRETAAVLARAVAGSVAEKSAVGQGTPAGSAPYQGYVGSGTPGGDYHPTTYTGGGTPAAGPNDGPGVSGGHSQSSIGGGATFLRAYNNAALVESEAWVEAHCALITIKVPNPKPFATLGDTELVDLSVWDCRGPMKNADALFVAKGAWEAIAGSTPKASGGKGSGSAASSAAGGGSGASGGIRGGGSGIAGYDANNPALAPAPTTQPGGKATVIVQAPTAPTPGDAAIVKALAPLGPLLARIAKAAENPPSDNLGLRRQGKL